MIARLTNAGISVRRVMNDSRKPAEINTGIRLISIFNPSFAPIINDSFLEYVPGSMIELPTTNPAAPAIIIADISSVPCIQITSMDCTSNPC